MYLRTIYELIEEGTTPLRARIAERLHQSGPTVSQTVARMERGGLLNVAEDRHLQLTPKGLERATEVMRKHRLAERLLTDIIELEWEYVHDEACRWEHVMSERVERRLVELLPDTSESPYGNPIPGLASLGGGHRDTSEFRDGTVPLTSVVSSMKREVELRRLAEPLQADIELLESLKSIGAQPGRTFSARRDETGDVLLGSVDDAATIRLDPYSAGLVFVAG